MPAMIEALTGAVQRNLSQTSAAADGRIKLSGELGVFVERLLTAFDQRHGDALETEGRILAGSETSTGNNSLPVSYQREIIREATADLNILKLVRTDLDPTAQGITQVPYEERTVQPANVPNGGIVFEGQSISSAGVSIKYDDAYVQPMKLAVRVSNEVIHFTDSAKMNWSAWAEQIGSVGRLVRELIQMRLANEMLRASDSFQAAPIGGESFTADTNGLIKTGQFPIAKPHQVYNLRGKKIGNPKNPISVTVAGSDVPQFTGEPNLPAGMYWHVSNANLGYVQLVDETGVPAGGNSAGAIDYSWVTNVVKFDTDAPANTDYAEHLNGLLEKIGDQKAMLGGHRMSLPDFVFMSYDLNSLVTKAEGFIVSRKRNGTDTDLEGDLETLHGVQAFESNTSNDLGNHRILMGKRGTTAYTVVKPFEAIGSPFEVMDDQGRATGEKGSYGEEYSAIHTPSSVCGHYTSILVFSASRR